MSDDTATVTAAAAATAAAETVQENRGDVHIILASPTLQRVSDIGGQNDNGGPTTVRGYACGIGTIRVVPQPPPVPAAVGADGDSSTLAHPSRSDVAHAPVVLEDLLGGPASGASLLTNVSSSGLPQTACGGGDGGAGVRTDQQEISDLLVQHGFQDNPEAVALFLNAFGRTWDSLALVTGEDVHDVLKRYPSWCRGAVRYVVQSAYSRVSPPTTSTSNTATAPSSSPSLSTATPTSQNNNTPSSSSSSWRPSTTGDGGDGSAEGCGGGGGAAGAPEQHPAVDPWRGYMSDALQQAPTILGRTFVDDVNAVRATSKENMVHPGQTEFHTLPRVSDGDDLVVGFGSPATHIVRPPGNAVGGAPQKSASLAHFVREAFLDTPAGPVADKKVLWLADRGITSLLPLLNVCPPSVVWIDLSRNPLAGDSGYVVEKLLQSSPHRFVNILDTPLLVDLQGRLNPFLQRMLTNMPDNGFQRCMWISPRLLHNESWRSQLRHVIRPAQMEQIVVAHFLMYEAYRAVESSAGLLQHISDLEEQRARDRAEIEFRTSKRPNWWWVDSFPRFGR